MANEKEGPGDFHPENFLKIESANANIEGASLESSHSAESESAASDVTQIEVLPSQSSSKGNQIKTNFQDAKTEERIEGDPSSSKGSPSTPTASSANFRRDSGEDSEREGVSEFSVGESSIYNKYENRKGAPAEEGEAEGEDDDDQSYEDDTVSSEAIVDDIELILMPETVQEFSDLSPQLVRVTELKRQGDYDADVFEDDDETDQESDFKKFGTDDEDGGNSERSISSRSKLRRKVLLASASGGGLGRPGGSLDENHEFGNRGRGSKPSGKVHSGVQTEISALETSSKTIQFEVKRRSSGKSSSRVGLSIPARNSWRSELTLLPSKMKIRPTAFSGYESMNYQDQYSNPRVAKFTSQDTLISSSQFLKPSTLYRTRNLSRNLNQCETSDSTLVLPGAGFPSTSTSLRYRERMSSSTSSNFKESHSTQQLLGSAVLRRQPIAGGQALSFRSSLPDLTGSSTPRRHADSKGNRRSFRSMKQHKSSSGFRLAKKSSNSDEDDTSSLIDESERCLRSSIDLLLTDDLPSSGADLSTRSTAFGGLGPARSTHGGSSSRRWYSQPIVFDDGETGDLRDVEMGSPFLPRKLSEMRCSRFAKVILPNGHVAVVAVKDIDEMKDSLMVQTDSGCSLSLPFRKVVFAWKIKR